MAADEESENDPDEDVHDSTEDMFDLNRHSKLQALGSTASETESDKGDTEGMTHAMGFLSTSISIGKSYNNLIETFKFLFILEDSSMEETSEEESEDSEVASSLQSEGESDWESEEYESEFEDEEEDVGDK